MSSSFFAVETRKQCALILGSDSALVKELVKVVENRGLTVFRSEHEISADYDLDYCLAVDVPFPPHFEGLRGLHLIPLQEGINLVSTLPSSVTTIIYPDLVGEGMTASPGLLSLLRTVVSTRQLKIRGEGLVKYYLLHITDLVTYAIDSLFSRSAGGVVFLADPDSPSELSFAYNLRSCLPYKIEIVFESSDGASQDPTILPVSFTFKYRALDYLPTLIKSTLPLITHTKLTSSELPKSSQTLRPAPTGSPDLRITGKPTLERHLKPLFAKEKSLAPVFVPLDKSLGRLTLPKLSSLSQRKHPSSPLRTALTGIVIGLALYFTSLIFAGTLAFLTSRQIFSLLTTYSLPSASLLSLAGSSTHYLEINLIAYSSLPGISSSTSVQDLIKLLSAYRDGISIGHTLEKISSQGRDIVSYVLAGTENDLDTVLEDAKLEISTLYEQLSLLDGSLPENPYSVIPAKYHDSYRSLKASLGNGRRAALSGKTILTTAPDLLGLGGRRKYLVLFQNNMELRATGGFIGSFAVLAFENGHLYDMPIYDVYTADGQLKGHVEPPKEIKEILGEANWYLRDSNWDPNFVTTARRAEWFLKKTLGIEVQGTIGINIYTLSGILRELGGITLPDYNEKITADNIFERAEYYSEVNFFPGSTGKKEILSSIASAVFDTMHNLSLGQTLGVVKALAEGIDNKHTLIAVSSPATARIFDNLGWDGSIREPDCPMLGEGSCLSDYAYLVESNFGVNKANYFMNRKLEDVINLTGEGTIAHNLKVSYTNTATSLAWPAGNYKNYARLYLPPSTTITSVAIDNRVLEPEDYQIYAEHGKTVLGLLVEVPINATVNLEVGYRLGSTLESSGSTYSYYWQKQSGTDSDPLTVKFNYDRSFEPDLISPRAALNDSSLGFGLVSNTDRRITVKFR